MKEPFSSEELEVATACWEDFKQDREWPLKKPFARRHPQWADPVLRAENKWLHIHVRDDVKPDWELLFQFPEICHLLAPLPRLINEAIARIIANPLHDNDPSSKLKISLADFQRCWDSTENARLAADLLVKLWNPWLGWGHSDPEDAWFYPHLDILRYENAQSLDDLLRRRVQRAHRTAGITEPTGPHLELLIRIHSYLKERGTWPEAVPFAIENRRVGFIPELVDELAPTFIRWRWHGQRDNRLKLTRRSFFLVGLEQERNLLVNAVRAMAQLWAATDESELDVSAQMVAQQLQEVEEEVGPLLRYLELEPWVAREPPDWTHVPWKLSVNDRIGRFKDVESWEDYTRTLKEYEEQSRAIVGMPSLERIQASLLGHIVAQVPGPAEGTKKGRTKRSKKAKPIFISHAEKDKAVADVFVDLLESGMGVRDEDIVYTSRASQAVPLGTKFRDYLRETINECSLFICLVSENFYASRFTLCEVGAAWGARKIIIPVMVPPLGPNDLDTVLKDGWQFVELLNEEKLMILYDLVRNQLKTSGDFSRWPQRVRKFFREAQDVLESQAVEHKRANNLALPELVHQFATGTLGESALERVMSGRLSALELPSGGTLIQAASSFDSSEWKTFEKLVANVKSVSQSLSPVLRAAAYASGVGLDAQVSASSYQDVADAESRGMIVTEGYKFWASPESRIMKQAIKPFEELSRFLEQVNESFRLEHEKRYGFVADLKNYRFAEEVIGFNWNYGSPDEIPF